MATASGAGPPQVHEANRGLCAHTVQRTLACYTIQVCAPLLVFPY